MLVASPRGRQGRGEFAMMGWDGQGHSGFGPAAWLLMVVFWIALIALIVFLVLKLLPGSNPPGGPSAGGRQESPEEIVDRMFALGEIDEETYRSRRSALAEMRRPS